MKLPVTKPSIISYLHHAYKLAILETNDKTRDYLINNFLQVYAPGFDDHAVGMAIDFYCYDGLYPRYPFLSWAWMTGRLLENIGGNVSQMMCASLDSQYYVEANLDEFYLPTKLAYRQYHFTHQNLIFGYCKERRIFYALGFDNALRFSEYTMTFDEFEAAMQCNIGVGLIGWSDSAKYSNGQEYSPVLIKTYLNDFVESRCSFVSYRPASAIFGAATYELATSMVEQQNGRALNVLPWCIFYEHKTKLCDLADYLVRERKAAIPDSIRHELNMLKNDFLELRNYLLEAKFNDTQVKIASLRRNLGRITDAEPDVIRTLAELAN